MTFRIVVKRDFFEKIVILDVVTMEEENDDVFLLQAAMTLKREMSQFLKQYTTST